MKEIKQNRKTKYTQMVLKDSLIELMKKKAISQITIKEICENADINRTTFYAHYADQYMLLKSIEDELMAWVKDIIVEFSGKTTKEDFVGNLVKVFEYLIENKNHMQVLMSEQGDVQFQRNLLSDLYAECGMLLGNEPHMNGNGENNELYFVFLINGSLGLIQHWLKTGLSETAHEMAEIIYNMARRADTV